MSHLIIILAFLFVPLYICVWFHSHRVVCRISPAVSLIDPLIILVLDTNFGASSAKLSESCMIGLFLHTHYLAPYIWFDITTDIIYDTFTMGSCRKLPNKFFLYWKDKSSINYHMNWFLNSENDPCNQMISVCMSLSITNSFEYISGRDAPIPNLSLFS